MVEEDGMAEPCGRSLLEQLERTPTWPHWERIGPALRSGVCVPVSALRSQRDCGVGDFGDIPALVDWCVEVGVSVIQILPVNDMGIGGTIPYAAISAFALDPLYIALDLVDAVRDTPDLVGRARDAAARLNRAPRIDYAAVRREKEGLLADAFFQSRNEALDETLAGFSRLNPWVDDYALYRALKERHGYGSWEQWGALYSEPHKLDQARFELRDRITFHLFEQWLSLSQLRNATDYAAARGVLLKGDIPILVGRDSADVWRNSRLFLMDTAAGAPPDMYAEDGQNWGFPTYNWAALEAEDFQWWRNRLKHAQQFFHMYRIDHVVGFFRIWTIPYGRKGGRDGAFIPADESKWGDHGRKLLTMMLDSCDMLPLAEDLGTIPLVCRSTLLKLGICGLKVQRWEKWWDGDGRFMRPDQYPPLSVATLSTHDSDTLAGWWQDNAKDRRDLWQFLANPGEPPARLPSDFAVQLIRWLASSRSLFMILMLQDILEPFGLLPGDPADHRINVPGTLLPTNWTWRCPVCLEHLAADNSLSANVKALLARP